MDQNYLDQDLDPIDQDHDPDDAPFTWVIHCSIEQSCCHIVVHCSVIVKSQST